MSLNEISLKIPNEHITNVFGQFDIFAKIMEIYRLVNLRLSFIVYDRYILLGQIQEES